MSDRDPFDRLRDLIDEPVQPRDAFAEGLQSRLMRELSASDVSREEQAPTMNAVITPRLPMAFPIESSRRIRPMVILELAAAAIIVLGLAAVLSRSWFQNDPDMPPSVPAVAQQSDETPTPVATLISTEATTGHPTVAPNEVIATVASDGSPETIWALPLPEGESFDFGGILVEDGVVYRLIATSDFVGVQAIDGRTGVARWQRAQQWAGDFFAMEDGALYFGGGDNTLVAVDAETGERLRKMDIGGNPVAMTEDDSRIFVLLDSDLVVALDKQTGAQLWVAQGTIPQNPTGGSVAMPANLKIAVENDTVAAISIYGVLSGFDAATGTERWSHEGFDAAMTTIQGEDDVFVVTTSSQTTSQISVVQATESGNVVAGSPVAASNEQGAQQGGQVSTDVSSAACVDVFQPSSLTIATPVAATMTSSGATTESGLVAVSAANVQGIDPATGAVIWEQQLATSSIVTASATGSVSICAVNATTGQMMTLPAGDDDSIDGNTVVVGAVTGGAFTPIQSADDAEMVAGWTTVGILSESSMDLIAVATDESGIYGMTIDGTLVKIAEGQQTGDDTQADDSTPEPEDD